MTTTCIIIGLPLAAVIVFSTLSAPPPSPLRSFAIRFFTLPPSSASNPNAFAICFMRSNGISVPASSAGILGASVA